MTRKDYELLASAIKAEADVWRGQGYGRVRLRALESLANRLANDLHRDNPRFDPARFLAACAVDA